MTWSGKTQLPLILNHTQGGRGQPLFHMFSDPLLYVKTQHQCCLIFFLCYILMALPLAITGNQTLEGTQLLSRTILQIKALSAVHTSRHFPIWSVHGLKSTLIHCWSLRHLDFQIKPQDQFKSTNYYWLLLQWESVPGPL